MGLSRQGCWSGSALCIIISPPSGEQPRTAAARRPLTEDWSSSIGDSRPLWPSSQLREGRMWSSAGGGGHPSSQPDQLNQPRRSMGRHHNQITLTSHPLPLEPPFPLPLPPTPLEVLYCYSFPSLLPPFNIGICSSKSKWFLYNLCPLFWVRLLHMLQKLTLYYFLYT